jgi:Fe-S-cluster-containing dehydrogenase component
MDSNNRRNFLKLALAGAGAACLSPTAFAESTGEFSEDRMGVLVDTTVCVGCRNCEFACKTSHNFPTPGIDSYKDRTVYTKLRRPTTLAHTVVNEFENPANHLLPTDVKVQCMHCEKPACVSACIVGAITKKENGSVVWDGDKCIGCRYCMVACPFQVPTFEYDKAIQPKMSKCDFCWTRTQIGKLPSCVDICPVEALTYGPRNELIKIAKQKMKRKPEEYIKKIYGEFEVGGTSWLYIANQDFNKLAFPKLGDKTAPGVSEAIQHGIFSYFFPPVALYSLLGGMMWITKRRSENTEDL